MEFTKIAGRLNPYSDIKGAMHQLRREAEAEKEYSAVLGNMRNNSIMFTKASEGIFGTNGTKLKGAEKRYLDELRQLYNERGLGSLPSAEFERREKGTDEILKDFSEHQKGIFTNLTAQLKQALDNARSAQNALSDNLGEAERKMRDARKLYRRHIEMLFKRGFFGLSSASAVYIFEALQNIKDAHWHPDTAPIVAAGAAAALVVGLFWGQKGTRTEEGI